jgi:hypothetical protein
MAGSDAYQPEDDDILVHRFGGQDVYFSVSNSYGHGRPHYYVCLDENGGEASWWLDPDQAERLGEALTDLGARCRELNLAEDQRLADLAKDHPNRP